MLKDIYELYITHRMWDFSPPVALFYSVRALIVCRNSNDDRRKRPFKLHANR